MLLSTQTDCKNLGIITQQSYTLIYNFLQYKVQYTKQM
jgi:hypothetical protein